MSRIQPNVSTQEVSLALHQLAYDVTRALEHAQRELSQASVYPSDTLAEHTSGGDPNSHWPPDSLVNVFEIKSRREDIRDAIDACKQTAASLRFLVDDLLGLRTGAPELFDATEYGVRCSGGDPTCQHWASEHTLTTGTKHDGLCDHCWQAACWHCGKPAQSRRVGGAQACEACYRRSRREQAA